ncbi:MAG: hypothetical protein CMJ95_01770, partial [Planctomycetes bacterium]|nr:hypothetical protein [Planctomycetota bacterium]
MLNAGNEHVLPEVRPVVTDMPEETYQAVTGGSARSRELPLLGGHIYDVRGVPGHTHNASATVSISGDFTRMRTADLDLANDWYAEIADDLGDNMYDDSEPFVPDTELLQYERAIEKAVGRVRVIPENCHQEIDEPTRAIAEIRTIVTAKAVLKSMTYVEELGTYVDAVTGIDASDDFVDSVQVHMFGYDGCKHNAANRLASTKIFNNLQTLTYKVLSRGVHTAGPSWDGNRTFTFDSIKRTYKAPELKVRLLVQEVGTPDANTNNDVIVGVP